jgi:hypothetical protein
MTSEKPVLESMDNSQIQGGDECVTFEENKSYQPEDNVIIKPMENINWIIQPDNVTNVRDNVTFQPETRLNPNVRVNIYHLVSDNSKCSGQAYSIIQPDDNINGNDNFISNQTIT